jgi:hypothetical protein
MIVPFWILFFCPLFGQCSLIKTIFFLDGRVIKEYFIVKIKGKNPAGQQKFISRLPFDEVKKYILKFQTEGNYEEFNANDLINISEKSTLNLIPAYRKLPKVYSLKQKPGLIFDHKLKADIAKIIENKKEVPCALNYDKFYYKKSLNSLNDIIGCTSEPFFCVLNAIEQNKVKISINQVKENLNQIHDLLVDMNSQNFGENLTEEKLSDIIVLGCDKRLKLFIPAVIGTNISHLINQFGPLKNQIISRFAKKRQKNKQIEYQFPLANSNTQEIPYNNSDLFTFNLSDYYPLENISENFEANQINVTQSKKDSDNLNVESLYYEPENILSENTQQMGIGHAIYEKKNEIHDHDGYTYQIDSQNQGNHLFTTQNGQQNIVSNEQQYLDGLNSDMPDKLPFDDFFLQETLSGLKETDLEKVNKMTEEEFENIFY